MKFFQLAIEDDKVEDLKAFFKIKTDGQLRGEIQRLWDKVVENLLAESYQIKGALNENKS